MANILIFSLITSLLATVLIIHFRHNHEKFTADSDFDGVQKFHSLLIPRVGGIPLFIGLSVGMCLVYIKSPHYMSLMILLAALPAFLIGLLEDLTKRVGVMTRLIATFVAAALGIYLLHTSLQRLGIQSVDVLMHKYWWLSAVFTVFAVGGIAHSLNVIDGYNGLAGVVAIFIFAALAYISWRLGDNILCGVCLSAIGAILGFLLFNFPCGLIFLGDGGAYVIGFLIAEISVLLVARHPSVSPWFPMLLVAYPAFETIFSAYRKKFLRQMSPGLPDGLHLHMLVYKRLVRWHINSKDIMEMTCRNSMTSPYLWLLSLISIIPAIFFWDNTQVLIAFTALFAVIYLCLYRMIVHFKVPNWMILRR